MDRDEVRAWMARWEIVNQHTIEETRALTPEEKFRKLEMLVASAGLFPPAADDEEEDQRVRELWMRLHAAYGTRRP
jgi:hypothetical protein